MPVRQGLQLYTRTGNITLVTYLETSSLDDILDGFKTNEQFEEEKVELRFALRANTAYNEVEITFDEIAAEVIGAKLDELHVDFIPNSVFLSPEEFDAVRQLDVAGVTIIGADAGLGNVVLNFKNRSYFLSPRS